MNGKEHTNKPDGDPKSSTATRVDLDAEISVAELVARSRKNLPNTVEEAQQQVTKWSKSGDVPYMYIGTHLLAVKLERRYYRYGCDGVPEYAEKKLGLASTTWRRYYQAAMIGFTLRDLDQKLLMGHCLEFANLRVKDDQELIKRAPDIIAKAMVDGRLTAPALKSVITNENGDDDSGDGDGTDKKRGQRLKMIYDASKAFKDDKVTKEMNEEQKAALDEYSKAADKLLSLIG